MEASRPGILWGLKATFPANVKNIPEFASGLRGLARDYSKRGGDQRESIRAGLPWGLLGDAVKASPSFDQKASA